MQKTWSVTWNGHSITAVNDWFEGERLLIDGALCAENGKMGITGDLVAHIEEQGRKPHTVKAMFRQGWMGLRIVCHIFVDDRFVGGDPV